MVKDFILPHVVAASAADRASADAPWDEVEFRSFHDATALRLRNYLRRAAGDRALADDLVQEAYLRFLRSTRNRQGVEPAAFLFRIATNLLYDHWRRAGRERRFLSWFRAAPPARDASLKHDVGRLLDELKPRDRALLWLAYVEAWSHDEIGQIMGLGPRSVRVMLFRARSRLAALLKQSGLGQEALR